MKLKMFHEKSLNAGKVSASCPHCGKEGTFDQVGADIDIGAGFICGQRRCPNSECCGHLFIVLRGRQLVAAYPPVCIDFDTENIPEGVCKTFEEALDCHAASCFTASAIMVRRTLEEICAERGANGANLKERIKDLESKIVLPKELIDAMNELRLLGNDAAHIEAQSFTTISTEELNIAIEFTKEILKGLYQYSVLLSRIRALKTD